MEAKQLAESIIEDLGDIAVDQKMSFVRRKLTQIDNPGDRLLAESFFLAGLDAAGKGHEQSHIIILIHGIRTQGVWQDKVASILGKHPHTKPIIIGFAYFDLLSFWLPYFFRRAPIERVEREIRGAMSDNPGAKISIIAHSFGTYITSQLLTRRPDIQINRLLLCGSIVDRFYPWDALRRFPTGGVLNHVGTKDILPAISKSVSWGYGSSGTFGFRTHKVSDRYFNFGHSDFFTEEHVNNYWVPYIINGVMVESNWSHERPTPPWSISMLEVLPVKSVGIPLLIYGIYKLYTLAANWITCAHC